jgi:hypothetical protein
MLPPRVQDDRAHRVVAPQDAEEQSLLGRAQSVTDRDVMRFRPRHAHQHGERDPDMLAIRDHGIVATQIAEGDPRQR